MTGTVGPDNDIDLLVVADASFNTWQNREKTRNALRGIGMVVDVTIMATKRFGDTRYVVGGIAHPANKHGKVLYAAA